MAFMTAMALGAVLSIDAGSSLQTLGKFSQAVRTATADNKAHKVSLEEWGGALAKLAAGGALVTAGVAYMGSRVAGFEHQMAAVGAVSLQTRDEIKELEAQALRLGSSTTFSAKEVADGMELMGRAGFTQAEVMAGLPGVLDAAAASGLTLAETANHVSNVLKGMGMETSEATRVADVLALAEARTNASMSEIGESMKNVSATAHQFNIPLEQVIASVAILKDVGLDASVAGSAMNIMLSQLTNLTGPMKKRLNGLGVVFQDVHGDMLPYPQVLENILKATQSVEGNMEAAGLLIDMFGQRGQKAGIQLTEAFKSGKLAALIEELEGAAGTATKMAELRLDSTLGGVKLLSNAFDTFAIKSMQPANEQLHELSKMFAGFISGVVAGMDGEGATAANKFGQGIAAAIGIVTGAFGLLMDYVIEPITTWLGGEGGGDWAYWAGVAVAGVTMLVVVLTPILGALAAGVGLIGLWGTLTAPVAAGFAALGGFAGIFSAMSAGASLFAKAWGIIYLTSGYIWAIWEGLSETSSGWASVFANWLLPAFNELWTAASSIFGLFEGQGADATGTFRNIGKVVGWIAVLVANVLGAAIWAVAKLVAMLASGFKSLALPFMNSISLMLTGLTSLLDGTTDVWSAIKMMFFGLINVVLSPFKGIIAGIIDVLASIAETPWGSAALAAMGIDSAEYVRTARDTRDAFTANWAPQSVLDKAASVNAVSSTPDTNVTINDERKTAVTTKTELHVDGKKMAVATKTHELELSDRIGHSVSPWQRRQILEQGATTVPAH